MKIFFFISLNGEEKKAQTWNLKSCLIVHVNGLNSYSREVSLRHRAGLAPKAPPLDRPRPLEETQGGVT